MRNAGFIWIIALIMAAIDFYVFQVVKMLCQGSSSQEPRSIIFTAYWALSIAIIIMFLFSSVPQHRTMAQKSSQLSVCNHRRIFLRQITGFRFFPGRRSPSGYSMGSCKNIFSEYRRRKRGE